MGWFSSACSTRWFLTASYLLNAGVASAQAPSAPADNAGGLDEIVVTAQRRSENIQNVPLSITALGGEQLQAAGVLSTQDLAQVTPGLVWGRSSNNSQPTIRGIGSRNASPGDESNVALYIDGIYQPEQFGTLFELADIERVEVLKGPQGTLFGRNATGGAISIVTKAPANTPEGSSAPVRLNPRRTRTGIPT